MTSKTAIVGLALTVIFAAFAVLLSLRYFSDVFSARAKASVWNVGWQTRRDILPCPVNSKSTVSIGVPVLLLEARR